MEALLQEAGKAALSDTAERAVYDEAIKQAKSEPEVHARHILVPTEDEAKAIVAQLKGGADFATLAKESQKTLAPRTAATLVISPRTNGARIRRCGL